jgi:glutamine amidotransferase
MGWNKVESNRNTEVFAGVEDERFYFVHSYAVISPEVSEDLLPSWSGYGAKFVSALEYQSLVATQFHPEKSGSAGLKLLSNWTKKIGA